MTSKKSILRYLYYLAIAFLVIVLYRTAWLSDDAYISYRCIENLVNGDGFTYNPGQRVQAFTHPLWAMLHIPFRLLFQDMYYIGLFVALSTSLLAIFFLLYSLKEIENRIFSLLLLISSASFIDFSTSGLENPLTNFLLISICLVYLSKSSNQRKSWLLSLISCLMLLNRMDSILLVLPLLILHFWQNRSLKTLRIFIVGFSPFLLWEAFAIMYYGFLFPLPAYAKLNVHLSTLELMQQGVFYFADLLKHDAISFVMIFGALISPILLKRKEFYVLSAGLALYLIYILYIGGDFMRGRFFASPYFLSLIILVFLPKPDWTKKIIPVIILLGLFGSSPPIFSSSTQGKETKDWELFAEHGITDERTFYFPKSGLIATQAGKRPQGLWVEKGKQIKGKAGKYFISGNMGFEGYFAGPEKHLVDWNALTDPFLAQLPSLYRANWRPGHNRRLIPQGLLESYTRGSNQLKDDNLKVLFDAVEIITKGPVWDRQRLSHIWDINFGKKYKKAIDWDFYTLPVSQIIHESDLQNRGENRMTSYSDRGIEIKLDKSRTLSLLEIELQGNCEYTCVFRMDEKIIQGNFISQKETTSGLNNMLLPAPFEEVNNIVLYPHTFLHSCQLGKIQLRK